MVSSGIVRWHKINARELDFVHETKMIDDLLEESERKNTMAIAVDEFGWAHRE